MFYALLLVLVILFVGKYRRYMYGHTYKCGDPVDCKPAFNVQILFALWSSIEMIRWMPITLLLMPSWTVSTRSAEDKEIFTSLDLRCS